MLPLACMRDRGALHRMSALQCSCLQPHCVPLHVLSSAVNLPAQKGRGFRDQERMEVDDPSIGAYDNPTGRAGKGPAECEWSVPCVAVICPATFPGLHAAIAVSAACCRGPYL